ncbi:MAG: hypothetical protein ABI950_00460, partial [Solirubrobacteraceae bacterium]
RTLSTAKDGLMAAAVLTGTNHSHPAIRRTLRSFSGRSNSPVWVASAVASAAAAVDQGRRRLA